MAKRALVVGINDYSNWNNGVTVNGLVLKAANLSCDIGDATDFAQLLKDAFLFDSVTALQDSQATAQAILTGIQGILSKSQAGDVMCFYFSGHGARLPEDPTSASTRYYEAIVPHDATLVTSAQVASIAQALPPSEINFTLVLDACHSGGMFLSPDAKGAAWDDAAAAAFQAACCAIVPWICLPDPSAINNNVSNLSLLPSGLCSMTKDSSKDNPDGAKATLLSACDYDEVAGAASGQGHSTFTQAILDTVNQSNFQISHPALLAALRQKISTYAGSNQTPQLRGRPVRLEENFLNGWNYCI
jgi:hypothetical protein